MTYKFFYNLTDEDIAVEQLVQKTTLLQEKSDVFLRSIEALLHFLKSFAMDLSEIHSERFKEMMDDLNQRFSSPACQLPLASILFTWTLKSKPTSTSLLPDLVPQRL